MNNEFQKRHIGPDEKEAGAMLTTIGATSLDELIAKIVPPSIRLKNKMKLPEPLGEYEMLSVLKGIASNNKVFKSYFGYGYYNCITPGVILRNMLENPSWYTQYTPYQAEIAQGRLEALLNFQTMVMDLTKMEIANASLLDEGTAAAEAMFMFFSSRPSDQGGKFFVSKDCFAQTIDILRTRAVPVGIDIVIGDHRDFEFGKDYFGALLQYPAADGEIFDYEKFCESVHAKNGFVVVAADIMSLALLRAPGEFGADVAVGTTQRFGIPMGYGGPHAAFFAAKDEFKRKLPGRIIGVTIDAVGNPALRMSLQTREQHIRREKATSNICTAQALLANMAGMYAVYHGPDGIRNIAKQIHGHARALSKAIESLGYQQMNPNYFDTVKIQANASTKKIQSLAIKGGMNFRYIDSKTIGITLDETTSLADIQAIVNVFAKVKNKKAPKVKPSTGGQAWESKFSRTSDYLIHPVFNRYRSETEMLRYIKSLENKDISLVHSMIPLGSCTMKLNATAEMVPVTWAEFSNIHPFAPIDQTAGYQMIFRELEGYLNQITGFAATSLQPNAGAQGEYAGLMVIREYFKSKKQTHRNVVLIPASAHGTNPASAVMAGYQVVVTKCDELGNIDIADLKLHAEKHKDNLAALMVTYPSTHGVYEEGIHEICEIIHRNGGQVYMDGANMNAQVGLTNPAMIGADVCHLNLHKTFCIPHGGGGGPGMGPICVAKHLAPFLPGHPLVKTGGKRAMTAVSSAPWGSASILLISYAYIRMMGSTGLTDATKYAILNANYINVRLKEHYEALYVGKNGYVAHEMILDTRSFKTTANIEVVDIAKRLMDYGFHAPTVSFPVPGTLMVEPTESESKAELDRFCEAMISIRQEIERIEKGADKEDNPLKHAPHTASAVVSDSWSHTYGREVAAFPLPYVRHNKFWPSVARVNDAHGDRNLICSCPPVSDYTS